MFSSGTPSPWSRHVGLLLTHYESTLMHFAGSEYKDRLELKSNSDRTLGVGIFNAESAILVLTSGTMLKAYIDSNNIRDVNLE